MPAWNVEICLYSVSVFQNTSATVASNSVITTVTSSLAENMGEKK